MKAILISYDYSQDASGFFTDPTRRSVLNSAADFYQNLISDTLSPITPTGGNTWNQVFSSSSGPTNTTISNAGAVAANTLLIYVGAYNLGGSELGLGGFGGYSASGSALWLDSLKARGKLGALSSPATAFAPWGGSIAFSSTASWYFDANTATDESFAGNDFYSVALHELGHVFGIGTAPSWTNQISGTTFNGAHTGAVTLTADGGHFASGTTSTIYGTNTVQEAALAPSLLVGSRKRLTALDVNALQDIGWSIVPEPSTYVLLVLGMLVFIIIDRRHKCGLIIKKTRFDT